MNWYIVLYEMSMVILILLVGAYCGLKIGFDLGMRHMLLEISRNKKQITDLLFDDYVITNKDKLIEKLKKNGFI